MWTATFDIWSPGPVFNAYITLLHDSKAALVVSLILSILHLQYKIQPWLMYIL